MSAYQCALRGDADGSEAAYAEGVKRLAVLCAAIHVDEHEGEERQHG